MSVSTINQSSKFTCYATGNANMAINHIGLIKIRNSYISNNTCRSCNNRFMTITIIEINISPNYNGSPYTMITILQSPTTFRCSKPTGFIRDLNFSTHKVNS